MTETFSPPRPPGFPARKRIAYNVKRAEFGEGYTQVAKDGINNSRVVYELTWPDLTTDEADVIETFMTARGGYEAFYYTVPTDVPRLYRNGEVIRAYERSGVVCSLSVTLIEVFS